MMAVLPVPTFLGQREIVYVDCGARSAEVPGVLKPFPRTRILGFEPDGEEARRLSAAGMDGVRAEFFDVAVGARAQEATFHRTASPGSSSFLPPNETICARFHQLHAGLEVVGTELCKMVSMDEFGADNGIERIDLLKLDVQGLEYDILQGASRYLPAILAIQVELEFAPIYRDQPLFGDVHSLLLEHGFQLFDLTRHRYQRRSMDMPSRMPGQLLWAESFYFKDYDSDHLSDEDRIVLALSAWATGFGDYAVEVLDAVGGADAVALAGRMRTAMNDDNSRALDRTLLRLSRTPSGRRILRFGRRAGRKCGLALDLDAVQRVD